MKNNRDMFIDLVEEINPGHLETHIKKNTDTRSKTIKRYIAATGIYAAACVAVLLLIPFIINYTGDVTPNTLPGVNPVTTEPVVDNDETIDEFFADTMLYKVLNTAGVKRENVERLQVGRHQIFNGDVYYRYGNEVYRNTESNPIMSENSKLGEFRFGNGYIYYTIFPYEQSSIQRPLYSYNIETKEKKIVCEGEILFFDFSDDEFVYVSGDSEDLTEYKVYSYNPETGKSELMHTIPAEGEYESSACFTGDKFVAIVYDPVFERLCIKEYDVHNKEWKGLGSISSEVKFTFADPSDGYYFSCEWTRFEGDVAADEGVLKRHVDGVWYMNPDTDEKQKVSGTPYNELYYVNGVLVGVNREEASVVVENHDAEKHGIIEDGKLFPRPESMAISYGDKSYSFRTNDPLYEYMYEKINARVSEGSLTEMTGRERPDEYIYRDNNVVRVEFRYYYDSQGAPFYPDKENSDTAFALVELHFPITGDNTDVVFITDRGSSNKPLKCYGTLADDPEIEAKILDYFSEDTTE